jgi:hypothetical protein
LALNSAVVLILASIVSSLPISVGSIERVNASVSGISQSSGESSLAIRGLVYNDTNGNLQPDENETGVSSWKVGLLKEDGSIESATTAQSSGAYEFSGLSPGKYILYLEDIPVSYIVTQPANSSHIILVDDNSASDVNFGVFKTSYQLVSDVSFNADIYGFTVEGIALDSSGNLYHADALNKVIRKFSANGTLLSTFGNGTLGIPGGLAIDSGDNIFVSEKFGGIKKFDANGNLLGQMNSTGN